MALAPVESPTTTQLVYHASHWRSAVISAYLCENIWVLSKNVPCMFRNIIIIVIITIRLHCSVR